MQALRGEDYVNLWGLGRSWRGPGDERGQSEQVLGELAEIRLVGATW